MSHQFLIVELNFYILLHPRGFESLRTSLSLWRKSQSSTDNDCPFPEPADAEGGADGANADGKADGDKLDGKNDDGVKDDLEFCHDDDDEGDDFLTSARARLRAKQRSNSVDASVGGGSGKGHHGALRSGLARYFQFQSLCMVEELLQFPK